MQNGFMHARYFCHKFCWDLPCQWRFIAGHFGLNCTWTKPKLRSIVFELIFTSKYSCIATESHINILISISIHYIYLIIILYLSDEDFNLFYFTREYDHPDSGWTKFLLGPFKPKKMKKASCIIFWTFLAKEGSVQAISGPIVPSPSFDQLYLN